MHIDTNIWCPYCGIELETHEDRGCDRLQPSNDDIPRDEMLLAEGLARYTVTPPSLFDFSPRTARVAKAIGGTEDMRTGSIWSASFNGAVSAVDPNHKFAKRDEGNPDAFSAGRALMLALESDS
jgi:hypothetical protein